MVVNKLNSQNVFLCVIDRGCGPLFAIGLCVNNSDHRPPTSDSMHFDRLLHARADLLHMFSGCPLARTGKYHQRAQDQDAVSGCHILEHGQGKLEFLYLQSMAGALGIRWRTWCHLRCGNQGCMRLPGEYPAIVTMQTRQRWTPGLWRPQFDVLRDFERNAPTLPEVAQPHGLCTAIAIEMTENLEGKVPTQLPRERRTPSLHLPERERKRNWVTVWQTIDDDQDPNQEGANDPILEWQPLVESRKKPHWEARRLWDHQRGPKITVRLSIRRWYTKKSCKSLSGITLRLSRTSYHGAAPISPHKNWIAFACVRWRPRLSRSGVRTALPGSQHEGFHRVWSCFSCSGDKGLLIAGVSNWNNIMNMAIRDGTWKLFPTAVDMAAWRQCGLSAWSMGETMEPGKPMACARSSASQRRHCVPPHRRLRSSHALGGNLRSSALKLVCAWALAASCFLGKLLKFTGERARSTATLLLHDFFWGQTAVQNLQWTKCVLEQAFVFFTRLFLQ